MSMAIYEVQKTFLNVSIYIFFIYCFPLSNFSTPGKKVTVHVRLQLKRRIIPLLCFIILFPDIRPVFPGQKHLLVRL